MDRKKYSSDISRKKFAEIEPLLRGVRRRTQPAAPDLYEVFCALRYVLRTGCQWRSLPGEFPKWQTVYSYYAKWSKPGQDGVSVLERALKKSDCHGPWQTGAQRLRALLDHEYTEREDYGYGDE